MTLTCSVIIIKTSGLTCQFSVLMGMEANYHNHLLFCYVNIIVGYLMTAHSFIILLEHRLFSRGNELMYFVISLEQ